jgi:cell fate regulator YaaT (PSP1 superfamily)
LTEIISVRFNSRGKTYYFAPSGLTVKTGENVIVETAKGLEYGECTHGNRMIDDAAIVNQLRPVVRIATDADRSSVEAGMEKGKEAFTYCQKKISELGLEMKLVDVEYGFEGNKILFFFTSDGRVDFRELVKDLAGEFHARIELRQIGVRDEAKMLGGLGVCGKQFCCSQFLGEFHPVSIKMAKVQGLSLNPVKISGTCGRLMCCLKYEECAYEDLVKKAPKVDAFVETPSGKGSVINVNLLRRNAKVRLEDGLDTTLKTFSFDDLDILGGKGRRAEYIAAKAEGRLHEAGFTVSPPPAAIPAKPPPPYNQFTHNARENQPSSTGAAPAGISKPDERSDQRAAADPKKKLTPAVDRPVKSGDKNAKAPPRPQPSDGAQTKKPYVKRYRNNRGKNR